MARIQLVMTDEDRDLFVHEARREGISLSEWLRLAARERAERRREQARFVTREQLHGFFARCDEAQGEGVEPDWEAHLATMRASRATGESGT